MSRRELVCDEVWGRFWRGSASLITKLLEWLIVCWRDICGSKLRWRLVFGQLRGSGTSVIRSVVCCRCTIACRGV